MLRAQFSCGVVDGLVTWHTFLLEHIASSFVSLEHVGRTGSRYVRDYAKLLLIKGYKSKLFAHNNISTYILNTRRKKNQLSKAPAHL